MDPGEKRTLVGNGRSMKAHPPVTASVCLCHKPIPPVCCFPDMESVTHVYERVPEHPGGKLEKTSHD